MGIPSYVIFSKQSLIYICIKSKSNKKHSGTLNFYFTTTTILQMKGLIQLSQIYKNDACKALQVKIPRVQQQPNSYDCGLFAIANVVEFCFSPDSFNPRIIYDVSKMRQHLIECLENGKMSAFPRKKKRAEVNLIHSLAKA